MEGWGEAARSRSEPGANVQALAAKATIGVVDELRGFLGGRKTILLWDGLGAHRSRAMHVFLRAQRDGLVVERLPT
jgi:hypothetical protein